ncbi:MAG: aminotransferase class I/II-fold pyridoxal phosphate-dependent enzyme [Bacteroidales bacterium]|nr:aminotransferase class I/II-fold pyridoxal phosphate-dependent enzyme [Bacteroidales bacterium]
MTRFENDYLEGCFPEILERLSTSNMEQTPGYGNDPHCETAKNMIRNLCGDPEASVHFLVGGTQTNKIVIGSILKPFQGVISADSGHINVHETGAIEQSGHKVLAIPATDGKISADAIGRMMEEHESDPAREHTVQPALVYISFPTELGTIYSKAELTAIHECCKRYDIPLFIDGARLGYGLAAEGCDLTIKDIAALADVFYIGGTKQGALFGEAVVFPNPHSSDSVRTTIESADKDFRYHLKQNGGMLAKGRALGIQFETLLGSDLYFNAARKADSLALRIRDAFVAKGREMFVDSPTNQQFAILADGDIERLQNLGFGFEITRHLGNGRTAVRFCTSWATTEESVAALENAIGALL